MRSPCDAGWQLFFAVQELAVLDVVLSALLRSEQQSAAAQTSGHASRLTISSKGTARTSIARQLPKENALLDYTPMGTGRQSLILQTFCRIELISMIWLAGHEATLNQSCRIPQAPQGIQVRQVGTDECLLRLV